MSRWIKNFEKRFTPKDWGNRWTMGGKPYYDDSLDRIREKQARKDRYERRMEFEVKIVKNRLARFQRIWRERQKEKKFDKAMLEYDYSWLLEHPPLDKVPTDVNPSDFGKTLDKNLYREQFTLSFGQSKKRHVGQMSKEEEKKVEEVAEGVGIGVGVGLVAAGLVATAPEDILGAAVGEGVVDEVAAAPEEEMAMDEVVEDDPIDRWMKGRTKGDDDVDYKRLKLRNRLNNESYVDFMIKHGVHDF